MNTTSGEIYLGFFPGSGSFKNGYMAIGVSTWTTILSGANFQTIRDGNWHCLEFEMDITNSVFNLWVDGVKKYANSSYSYGSIGTFRGLQHFSIGNTLDHTGKWQSSWQAMELDDFILSTTYIGPDSDSSSQDINTDNNPPANPTGIQIQVIN